MFDNYHFQYEAGFMTEEAWSQHRTTLARLVRQPHWQYVMATFEMRLSFKELCDRLYDENQSGNL